MKKLLKQGIIVLLIISLAFSPVFALENGSSVSQGEMAQTQQEESIQEYEESADSWRYQNGELLRENASSAPRLFSSFTPWEWSSSEGGYLSSDGTVIEGAIRKGVDVSSWQGEIDWEKVKNAGIGFAIIRCGYGDDLTHQDDKYWIRNVQQCEAYGIPYGVYIYSYAKTDAQATSEANHVLRLLAEAEASPDYPVYYDLEDEVVRKCGKTAIVRRADIFCSAVEAQGYRAGIYASLSWWNNYLNDSSLDQYEKWVAQWNSECQYEGSYRLWQCTSDGTVPGIEGRVDINFELQMDDTDYYMGRWITDENGLTVFQKADGTIAVSQWFVYKGKKYYVDATGQKAEGFNTINDKKYYFKNGVLQKKKWLAIEGKKYYAKADGELATGYKKIDGYYYGFNPDGVMLTGTKILNGKRYKFTKEGKAHLFKAKTKTALNYRTGPSNRYKRKGTFKKNKTVTIIRKKNGWGQMLNGYWVKLSYTKKTTKYPLFVSYKARLTAKTAYRTGPAKKYKKKGVYKKGKVVTIKAARNGWAQLKNGYWLKLSDTERV